MNDARALVAVPVAHRGLHDRRQGVIENTARAANAAIARGFAIECDVQISADGEAMVFHDFQLERLTSGAGAVSGHSVAALQGLAIKDSTDIILTLAQFLALLGGRVPLICEIKSRFDGDMRLTRRTVELLKGYAGPFGIKSFDARIVTELRRIAPAMPRGIVGQADYSHHEYHSLTPAEKHAHANLLHFAESRPDFISWQVADLVSAAPYLCRTGIGLPLMTWTVRTPEQRAQAASNADQMVFEGFLP